MESLLHFFCNFGLGRFPPTSQLSTYHTTATRVKANTCSLKHVTQTNWRLLRPTLRGKCCLPSSTYVQLNKHLWLAVVAVIDRGERACPSHPESKDNYTVLTSSQKLLWHHQDSKSSLLPNLDFYTPSSTSPHSQTRGGWTNQEQVLKSVPTWFCDRRNECKFK